MEPVVFNDCFGWLHAAQGRHGVVLCNPFGYDAYCTHRGWRKLAEGIAAAGMPTLRFDYPGTGDSAGWEDDPRRIDAWLESIEAAVRWLRAKAGLERVSLVGFRLGATLAALAAERIGDIDGLVLMAPVVSGSIYVRELRAHRRIWRRASPYLNVEPVDETDGYVEVYGFGLRGEDIAEIGALDLRHDTGAPARRVLILDTNQRGSSGALAERYVSQGVMVEQDSFDEFERFLVEPVQSTTPAEAFTRATQWLAAEDAPLPMQARGFAQPEQSDTLRLPHSQATEQPVVFDRYFGIYCEPDAPQFDAPAVLIVNTGAGHHIGDGRLSVAAHGPGRTG
jgi:pimeloyl-ACP methyl ester carboxylesterase